MSKALREMEILAPGTEAAEKILTAYALDFIGKLNLRFNKQRLELLQGRRQRQLALDKGCLPDFLAPSDASRQWQVASCPADLLDRRVEITGPVERKMMINALNSGACVFMADFEDALSPSWINVIDGQVNLIDAVAGTLTYTSPQGKDYRLNEKRATLVVRPRGWHLEEKHVLHSGQPVSASLFDFGLYFYHNAHQLLARGSGPYFYLPKLENHLEARLWNDVFNFAQDALKIPRGTIRATVLIETILAAFEMEEILFELKEHASGLNAGRWDYIFSMIKKLRNDKQFLLPDRAQVTMTVPFMKAYCDLLVAACHRHGAHAMGGMAAFIPDRKDPEITNKALNAVRQDKQREVEQGFDGTWVAHPDLVPVATEVFNSALKAAPHQKHILRDTAAIKAGDLLNVYIEGAQITETGLRTNISVALQYMASWLSGAGAAAINDLMEDAATAEISRCQLWQWLFHKAKLSDGNLFDKARYRQLKAEELHKLTSAGGANLPRLKVASEILDRLVLQEEFSEFFTSQAYEYL